MTPVTRMLQLLVQVFRMPLTGTAHLSVLEIR